MLKSIMMRPQDVVILLKIIAFGNQEWRRIDLAESLGLSPAEITKALERCRISRLIDTEQRHVYTLAFMDFLQYGLQYVFPVIPQAPRRGMPTAVSSPIMTKEIVQGDEKFVWPTVKGSVRGIAITPLYPTVPMAAAQDPFLYNLLALADCLRIGRVRERTIAIEKLKQYFTQYHA